MAIHGPFLVTLHSFQGDRIKGCVQRNRFDFWNATDEFIQYLLKVAAHLPKVFDMFLLKKCFLDASVFFQHEQAFNFDRAPYWSNKNTRLSLLRFPILKPPLFLYAHV